MINLEYCIMSQEVRKTRNHRVEFFQGHLGHYRGHQKSRISIKFTLALFKLHHCVIYVIYHFLGQGFHFWSPNLHLTHIDPSKSNMAAVKRPNKIESNGWGHMVYLMYTSQRVIAMSI